MDWNSPASPRNFSPLNPNGNDLESEAELSATTRLMFSEHTRLKRSIVRLGVQCPNSDRASLRSNGVALTDLLDESESRSLL